MSRSQHPSRRRVLQGGALLGVTAGLGLPAAVAVARSDPAGTPAAAPTAEYPNPLVQQRADPHIVRHSDGWYYFTATVPEYDRIVLRRAQTLSGLATAEERVIWTRHTSGEMGAHIWAPELHAIDGRWYLYFAAGRTDDVWAIRMYVLENSDPDPLSGQWVERGRINDPWDTFALDATTFEHRGTRYLSWAQHDPDLAGNNTGIFLSELADPWTITGPVARLSVPEYAWETIGHAVNEGPYALQRNGRVFLTYSASATDSNYCVGLLTADDTSDLLDPASWTKSAQPVFASSESNGQWGPGHNSFTVDEDGSDVLVYHARQYRDITGDPLNDPNRHTRVQTLGWTADGVPDFGVPVPDSATDASAATARKETP